MTNDTTPSFPGGKEGVFCNNILRIFSAQKGGERRFLPRWQKTGKKQKAALCLGEQPTAMGKPGMMQMIHTMLTNKAVGE